MQTTTDSLYRRLEWAHGRDRAHRITSGLDSAYNRDLESWRLVGKPKPPPSWEREAVAVLQDVLWSLRWRRPL